MDDPGWPALQFFQPVKCWWAVAVLAFEECPIYDEFDWNLPGRTFGVVVASVVAYFIVAGIYTAFAPRSRDQDFKGIEKDKETGQFHTISL